MDQEPHLDNPSGVLDAAVASRRCADLHEVRIVQLATLWADQHPPAEPDDAAWDDDEYPSLPQVAWTAIPEFAAALGMSTQGGEHLALEALEARHRLPNCWAAMGCGELPAWRLRRIAGMTLRRPDDVAAYVDEVLAPIASRVGVIKIDKIIQAAMMRLHPEEHELEELERLQRRFVRLWTDREAHGLAGIEIRTDAPDALAFDAIVAAIAARLAEQGDLDTLDVRRAKAVGILADPAAALALLAGDRDEEPDADASPAASAANWSRLTGRGTARKQLQLVVHLSNAALHGHDPVARWETGDQPVFIDAVRRWAGREDVDVTVQPVIDCNDHLASDAYEAKPRLRAQVAQRFRRCMHPHCNRPARRCDVDHARPHAKGGRTCSCNLMPLCRRHHRLKTFTAWRYERIGPLSVLWSSPHGRRYLVDDTGTRDVTGTDLARRHPPGHAPPETGPDGCNDPPAA